MSEIEETEVRGGQGQVLDPESGFIQENQKENTRTIETL